MDKRKLNERKFDKWEELEDGGRKYCLEVKGRFGWKAIYIKIVDVNENALKFYQEIYNIDNVLIESSRKISN